MTPEELFSIILATTYTTADFHRRIRLLRGYFEKRFYTQGGSLTIQEYLSGQTVSQSDVNCLLQLGDNFYNAFTSKNAYTLLDSIQKELKNAATIILYVPIVMDSTQTDALGVWFRQNLPVNVIVDLKVDSLQTGGCSFVWNGMLRDYSLRYYLYNKKEDISALIASYGPKQ